MRNPHSAGDVIEAQGDRILELVKIQAAADALAAAVDAYWKPRLAEEMGALDMYGPEDFAVIDALAEYRKIRPKQSPAS